MKIVPFFTIIDEFLVNLRHFLIKFNIFLTISSVWTKWLWIKFCITPPTNTPSNRHRRGAIDGLVSRARRGILPQSSLARGDEARHRGQ